MRIKLCIENFVCKNLNLKKLPNVEYKKAIDERRGYGIKCYDNLSS